MKYEITSEHKKMGSTHPSWTCLSYSSSKHYNNNNNNYNNYKIIGYSDSVIMCKHDEQGFDPRGRYCSSVELIYVQH